MNVKKTIFLIEHTSIKMAIEEPLAPWTQMMKEYESEEAAIKKITFYRQTTADHVWQVKRKDIQESIVYSSGGSST